jgi:hypothetical protein
MITCVFQKIYNQRGPPLLIWSEHTLAILDQLLQPMIPKLAGFYVLLTRWPKLRMGERLGGGSISTHKAVWILIIDEYCFQETKGHRFIPSR